jgi:hypothetical protein
VIIDLERKWRPRARCLGEDPETFFTDHAPNVMYRGKPTAKVALAWEKAKIICGDCPVRKECARDHLGEVEGIWGGLDPAQRAQLRRVHSTNVRNLRGPVKLEYAQLAATLHKRKVVANDIGRLMGISTTTVNYLVAWHKGHLEEQAKRREEQPLQVQEVPRKGRRRKGVTRTHGTSADPDNGALQQAG